MTTPNATKWCFNISRMLMEKLQPPEQEFDDSAHAFWYIVFVLMLYAFSIVVLMIKYIKKERETGKSSYYDEYVKRERFQNVVYDRTGRIIQNPYSFISGLTDKSSDDIPEDTPSPPTVIPTNVPPPPKEELYCTCPVAVYDPVPFSKNIHVITTPRCQACGSSLDPSREHSPHLSPLKPVHKWTLPTHPESIETAV